MYEHYTTKIKRKYTQERQKMNNFCIEATDAMMLLLLDIKKLEKIHFDFDDEIDSIKGILEKEDRFDVLQLGQFDRIKLNNEIEIDYILKIKSQVEQFLDYLGKVEAEKGVI